VKELASFISNQIPEGWGPLYTSVIFFNPYFQKDLDKGLLKSTKYAAPGHTHPIRDF